MSRKNDILDAWIMVEHLSEGDINLKDKTLITFGELQNENYYRLFLNEMRKRKIENYKKGGIVVYFDAFPFKEVVDFLREKYHLEPEEEITYNHKFSFALCFDKRLKIQSEMTFLTESFYIRKYRKIPKKLNFQTLKQNLRRVLMRYLNTLRVITKLILIKRSHLFCKRIILQLKVAE